MEGRKKSDNKKDLDLHQIVKEGISEFHKFFMEKMIPEPVVEHIHLLYGHTEADPEKFYHNRYLHYLFLLIPISAKLTPQNLPRIIERANPFIWKGIRAVKLLEYGIERNKPGKVKKALWNHIEKQHKELFEKKPEEPKDKSEMVEIKIYKKENILKIIGYFYNPKEIIERAEKIKEQRRREIESFFDETKKYLRKKKRGKAPGIPTIFQEALSERPSKLISALTELSPKIKVSPKNIKKTIKVMREVYIDKKGTISAICKKEGLQRKTFYKVRKLIVDIIAISSDWELGEHIKEQTPARIDKRELRKYYIYQKTNPKEERK